jgi:hypothetical protein
MANLLRALLFFQFLGLNITILMAFHKLPFSVSHIQFAIPFFLFTIFAQAFVMFYFIGISRLTVQVQELLMTNKTEELFEHPPEDLIPYKRKVGQIVYETALFKRKVIPWTMLILTLGSMAFLLGGAHDTSMVKKEIHSGVVYGFYMATLIGTFQQWLHLGKGHKLLKTFKEMFSLSHQQM